MNLAILFALGLGVASAAADMRGGSGEITLDGVGPLRFERSSQSRVLAFAGKPNHVVPLPGFSSPTYSYSAKDFVYDFPHHAFTEYYLVNPGGHWVFAGFDTTLERFHTARGTRTGMSSAAAERREHIHRLEVSCFGAALVRRKAGREVAVTISRSRVADLYALGPQPFAVC